MGKLKSGRELFNAGFTLIELVMVIMLLAILAAIAIPNFIDFRADAKNAATQGALGAFRAALAVATAAIQLKEDPTLGPPKYPTLVEMQKNQFVTGPPGHPVLAAASAKIMDAAQGVPLNPWSMTTVLEAEKNSIYDCSGLTKGTILTGLSEAHRGWCYNSSEGQIWANSKKNSASPSENQY